MDIRAPNPQEILGPVTSCFILTFSSVSQAIILISPVQKATGPNSHTPVLPHNSFPLHSRIEYSTNITIVLTINIYIYIYIYLDIIYSSFLSVRNSERANSATHSVPLQQLVTMQCAEHSSPPNCHYITAFTYRGQVKFISCRC